MTDTPELPLAKATRRLREQKWKVAPGSLAAARDQHRKELEGKRKAWSQSISVQASRLRQRGAKITSALYVALAEAQGHVCAICGGTNGKKRLAADHDHATGIVRGLLCTGCNLALGNLRENRVSALLALAYLVHHQDVAPIVAAPLRIPTKNTQEEPAA